MALLTLKDIGKIYASQGAVSVGIRGVNLSFQSGEFVAITGKSGSGKSTLLNVISGMDTYEEGELYIEGAPTSHYQQADWEEYRSKYISFIFQDYNIIESFTVLQNVELALMHIEDVKERRARAMELICRVGLESHIRQKGSKLSGGQKQRTVIARALAKDSPIILADEPTGNLDSVTSKEIIELLKEVSKNKLLIVVTHNFEQVQEHATRHIRIFDGAVESDHMIQNVTDGDDRLSSQLASKNTPYKSSQKPSSKSIAKKRNVKNGFLLGKSIFTAKPLLTSFICLLMIIGMLGIFAVTATCGDGIKDLFEPSYMFHHIDGRVVLTKRSGEVFTDQELQTLAQTHGAENILHYDVLLDLPYKSSIQYYNPKQDEYDFTSVELTYSKDFGKDIIGTYPQADDEVFLHLPIWYRPAFGTDPAGFEPIYFQSLPFRVSGVKYYYDNNKPAECMFTENGFRVATALYYLKNNAKADISVTFADQNGNLLGQTNLSNFVASFDVEDGKIFLNDSVYRFGEKGTDLSELQTQVTFSMAYYSYNYYAENNMKGYVFKHTYTNEDLTKTDPKVQTPKGMGYTDTSLVISTDALCELAEGVLKESYRQASLFFADDETASRAADVLNEDVYLAIPSNTTYTADPIETIGTLLVAIMMAFTWVITVVFLAFFINLCSSRALKAFKGDMAIMRSMGISVKVIRIGMYVRMLISLIPACVLMVILGVLIYTTPQFNQYFMYLYGWQYALILLGMVILAARVTHKQIRKLFGESVKKALRGGDAE